ncbi:hypothetical protein CsatA_027399 [Cannabis sativa]
MDPRISFSNDFVDNNNNNNNNLLTAMQIKKHEAIYREAPVSSDFEFSVKNYSMRSADEIMFQGMLLPSMKNNSSRNSNNNLLQQQQIQKKNTLKDELLVDHDDDEDDDVDDYGDIFSRPPKSLARWKERFGLKKSNILGRKIKTTSAANAAAAIDHHMVFDTAFTTKQNQEKVIFEGGLKCIENNAM